MIIAIKTVMIIVIMAIKTRIAKQDKIG